MARRSSFDEAYYQRYYRDPRTRAMSPQAFARLGEFAASYVRYLGQPVRRALDLGCGLGRWREVAARHFPRASYLGVEVSEYLCRRYGWQRGSVVDFRARTPFDLVICYDVLQYLDTEEAAAAIDNLAALCRGVLVFAALTEEDWRSNCDRRRTDGNACLRSGRWYRERLAAHFTNAGGGVFVSERSPVVLFELERAES